MRKMTACDGVMIGRGGIGNPWIFKQTLALIHGHVVEKPSLSERKSFILDHFQLLRETMGEHRAALNMRGLLLWYTKGLPHSSRFRGHITNIRDLDSLISIMDHYFSHLQEAECEG